MPGPNRRTPESYSATSITGTIRPHRPPTGEDGFPDTAKFPLLLFDPLQYRLKDKFLCRQTSFEIPSGIVVVAVTSLSKLSNAE
jgi:hypothetical protein